MLIVVRNSSSETAFADAAAARLGSSVVGVVKGQPPDLRDELEKLTAEKAKFDAIAASEPVASWALVQKIGQKFPEFTGVAVVAPKPYRWPNFLTSENLINIANRIAVIAIIAIGMTMVIITAGIDLSVGSLIALASVVRRSGRARRRSGIGHADGTDSLLARRYRCLRSRAS